MAVQVSAVVNVVKSAFTTHRPGRRALVAASGLAALLVVTVPLVAHWGDPGGGEAIRRDLAADAAPSPTPKLATSPATTPTGVASGPGPVAPAAPPRAASSPEPRRSTTGRVVTSPGSSPSSRSRDTRPADGELTVPRDSWVDLDGAEPTRTPVGGALPPAVDLQVGPDNLYPTNGTLNWFSEGARTCTSQRSAGIFEALSLIEKLDGQPGEPVAVCVRTTTGTFYRLAISTSDVNGYAPYDMAYSLD